MTKKLVTRSELAKDLGNDPQTITKWVAAGMPVAERGRRGRGHRYRKADVVAWLKKRETKIASRDNDLNAARTRKELAQAIVSELRAAEIRQDLLPRDDVEQLMAAERDAIKAKLLIWSTTLPDLLYRTAKLRGVGGLEIVIEKAVHEILEEFADPERPIECPNCLVDLVSVDVDPHVCRGRTARGKRCKNKAGESGFCTTHTNGKGRQ